MATNKTTNKTEDAKPRADGKKRYHVTTDRMVNREGTEVWLRGSEIWLDDETARRHMAKGKVRPADETKLPEVKPAIKVNEEK